MSESIFAASAKVSITSLVRVFLCSSEEEAKRPLSGLIYRAGMELVKKHDM
jgi:hypothetical protein